MPAVLLGVAELRETVVRGQDTEASCGARALYNALAALGIKRGTEELERLCGVTMTDGVSTKRLVNVMRTIEGLHPVVIRERRKDLAMMRLHEAAIAGRPVIIVVQCEKPDDHYVAVLSAVGVAGSRYLVADSADNEIVISKSAEELRDWWGAGSSVAWGVAL